MLKRYQLKPLPLESIPPNSKCLFLGPAHSGKTTALENLRQDHPQGYTLELVEEQWLQGIPLPQLQDTNYVFLLGKQSVKDLQPAFAKHIPGQEFALLYDTATADYGCLVLKQCHPYSDPFVFRPSIGGNGEDPSHVFPSFCSII